MGGAGQVAQKREFFFSFFLVQSSPFNLFLRYGLDLIKLYANRSKMTFYKLI